VRALSWAQSVPKCAGRGPLRRVEDIVESHPPDRTVRHAPREPPRGLRDPRAGEEGLGATVLQCPSSIWIFGTPGVMTPPSQGGSHEQEPEAQVEFHR